MALVPSYVTKLKSRVRPNLVNYNVDDPDDSHVDRRHCAPGHTTNTSYEKLSAYTIRGMYSAPQYERPTVTYIILYRLNYQLTTLLN